MYLVRLATGPDMIPIALLFVSPAWQIFQPSPKIAAQQAKRDKPRDFPHQRLIFHHRNACSKSIVMEGQNMGFLSTGRAVQ